MLFKASETKLTQTYRWSGINATQQRVKGEEVATSGLSLKTTLKQRGIKAIKIHPQYDLPKLFLHKKISEQKITDFLQQLNALLSVSIPLMTALELSAQSYHHKDMRSLIVSIKTHIENGETFSESLLKHPLYFNLLCCDLIYAGEQIGNLSAMLTKIVEYRKTMALIKDKIIKALFYPLAVLCIATLITMILLFFVIPELQRLFLDFGKQLPAYTRWIMTISTQFRQAGWLLPFYLLLGCAIFYWLSTKSAIKKHLPLLHSISEHYLTASWSYTLAITLNAGIPLAQSLGIVIKTLDNSDYQHAFQQIRAKIMQGQNFYTAMQYTALFPLCVKQMIYIGEQSGLLPTMLTQVSLFYQSAANDRIEKLLILLEPLLIIFLGVIIGSIVIAMYLPIFKLGSII